MTPITILSTVGAATDSGHWVQAGDWRYPISLHFPIASGTDAFDVRVSNNPSQPADGSDEISFAVFNSAAGKLAVTEPYAWIKVKKTAATQSTVVYLMAQQRK